MPCYAVPNLNADICDGPHRIEICFDILNVKLPRLGEGESHSYLLPYKEIRIPMGGGGVKGHFWACL